MDASISHFALGLCVGGVLGIGSAWCYAKRSIRKNEVESMRCDISQNSTEELQHLQEKLSAYEQEIGNLSAGHQHKLDHLQQVHERECYQLQVQLTELRNKTSGNCESLTSEIDALMGLVKTFERWHIDMDALIKHNRGMQSMNEEFSLIIRHMILVTLNASIEAARAGELGRGFGVVSVEMRELAMRAERLSKDYRNKLDENNLITTMTFQDLQAGSKMIMGSVVGIGMINKKTKEALEENNGQWP